MSQVPANVASRTTRKTERSHQPAFLCCGRGCLAAFPGIIRNPARWRGDAGPGRVLFLRAVGLCADLRLSIAAGLDRTAKLPGGKNCPAVAGACRRPDLRDLSGSFGLDFPGASGSGRPSQPGRQCLDGAGVDPGRRSRYFLDQRTELEHIDRVRVLLCIPATDRKFRKHMGPKAAALGADPGSADLDRICTQHPMAKPVLSGTHG